MAHIDPGLDEEDAPGIRGPLRYRPEAARPLGELAEVPPRNTNTALLTIAGAVARSGRDVVPELISESRAEGATDLEIHDTVLIAAAFCMVNRYVDGLGTVVPSDPAGYEHAARQVVAAGYRN